MGPTLQSLGRNVMERHVELSNQIAEHRVVADHRLDPGIDASKLVTNEEVSQTVMLAGSQHDDPLGSRLGQTDHSTRWQGGLSLRHELLARVGVFKSIELGAHEEAPRRGIHELLIADDIAAMAQQHATNGVHQSPLIRALDQKDRHG